MGKGKRNKDARRIGRALALVKDSQHYVVSFVVDARNEPLGDLRASVTSTQVRCADGATRAVPVVGRGPVDGDPSRIWVKVVMPLAWIVESQAAVDRLAAGGA